MTMGMSFTHILGFGAGSDPGAGPKRSLNTRDRVSKGRKTEKIGLKPALNGVWGASNAHILQWRGRISL